MFTAFERLWSVNDTGGTGNITAVVAISYAATDRRLTRASAGVAELVMKEWASAPILWGIFSEQSNRQKQTEREKKKNIFSSHRYKNFYIGEVSSSTDECEFVIEAAEQNGISLARVLVVAWGPHSRRDRVVWKYMLRKRYGKNSEVVFRSLPGPLGEDIENPMKLQRRWKTWLAVNLLLFPFYKFLPGVGWFAKHNFHQPSS